MSLYPFPINVMRVFPLSDIEVLTCGTFPSRPTICLTTHTIGDRAIALVLLKGIQDSFVLFEGARYFSSGTVFPCDPTHPASLTELCQAFDVETVEIALPGPCTRVHIFTHTLQEWEDAKAAVRHLLDRQLLSPRSYIEGHHTGENQGLSAQNLDSIPHRADLVALFREGAYGVQNDLYEKDAYDEGEDEWEDKQEEEEENDDDDIWEDEWGEDDDDDTWEDEAYEDENMQQGMRENLDEEAMDGAMADSREEDGGLIGALAPLRRHLQIWLTRALDW